MPFKIGISGRTSNPDENFGHWSKMTLNYQISEIRGAFFENINFLGTLFSKIVPIICQLISDMKMT